MDPEEVAVLQRERNYIAQELSRSGRFFDVVFELKILNVIEPDVAFAIINSETTKTLKVQRLLRELLQRGQSGTYQLFMDVLVQYGLSHIVKRLDPRAFEKYGSIIGGDVDRLDAERLPDFQGVGAPLNQTYGNLPSLPRPNLPTLPPHNSAQGARPRSDSNGNNNMDVTKPLMIKVIPAVEYGGARFHADFLYRNESMPRGLVFLANYKDFHNNEHPSRAGSEIDVKNLSLLFAQMGYKVPQVHINCSKYETIKALRDFRNLEEHASVDSCIVIIMSHGRDDKSFYTSDNNYLTVNDVVERFNNLECEALKEKPKIFIFQYCRGTSLDKGVDVVPKLIKAKGGLSVATDAAFTSVVDRAPTFSDMYIVYSTVEGFVSFRSPERGSWLMEAICNVFMNHAHDTELEALMKMVSRQVRDNLSDEGNKQVCEFVQRGFDRHFFFNPQPPDSTERLSMQALSNALSESVDSLEGAASPILRTSPYHRHLRPISWSRGSTPDPYLSPGHGRHRHWSGNSNSSDYNGDEMDPALLTSPGVVIHPRARRRSGNQRHASEVLQFLQPSFLPDRLETYNRSFSENVLSTQDTTPDPARQLFRAVDTTGLRHPAFVQQPVFFEAQEQELSPISVFEPLTPEPQDQTPSPMLPSYDTVDHPNQVCAENLQTSDINMNTAESCDEAEGCDNLSEPRHSIKRQLSFPSTNETLTKINDVKKFLQIHDSDPQLVERLERVESFVNKKKYEGKRRRKETEASSLEY